MISKPDLDDRNYLMITLPNALQVLLVSDPSTDKSAAALDVNVGHLSDPPKIHGLAHFCEHLLFMGTEKYPSENEYSQFLTSHGGSSNAFTSEDHTNYFFEVQSSDLKPALDRFSQFFKKPLFPESCNERELLAVDSEHKKNIQSDPWRFYQVIKDLCDPDHPFSGFGTGNLKTLKEIPEKLGLNIRDVLVDFHSKYYSSNIMKLVILGKESLDVLQGYATEMFSEIPNKNIEAPRFGTSPIKKESLPLLVLIKSVKDMKNLSLTFPCIDELDNYKTHPFHYIAHLIGHEGPGSILSLVKKRGLANTLSAGLSRQGARGFDMFRISLELTEKGLEEYQSVIEIVFQYIELLKLTGCLEWIFRECANVSQMQFRFTEKSSPSSFCSNIAKNMHVFEEPHTLIGPYLMSDYDPELVNSHLNYLHVDNMLVSLQSDLFEPVDWRVSEYYGTEYNAEKLDSSLHEKLANIKSNDSLSLPQPNLLIPESFLVYNTKSEIASIQPKIIHETPVLRLWHKLDDTFLVPKTNAFFEIRSSIAYSSVENCVLTCLYTDLLKDLINEFSYFSDIAGLSFHLDNTIDGLVLDISGFNDKLDILLKEIVDKMAEFDVKEDSFVRVKNQLKKNLKGWFFDSPHSHAIYFMAALTQEKLYTNEQKLAILDKLTLAQLKSVYKQILGDCHIQGLVHGNTTEKEAIRLGNILTTGLNPNASLVEPLDHHTRVIGNGQSIIYARQVFDKQNLNSALQTCYQTGSISDEKIRTFTNLISHIAQEPAFNQLRTKEQLGYLVHCGLYKQSEMLSLRFIIQSEHDPVYIETRIENFLLTLRNQILALTDLEYQKLVKALVGKCNEKLKNLNHESTRMWSHITSRYFDFNQLKNDGIAISKISKLDILGFYDENILGKNRRRASVHMKSLKIQKVYEENVQGEMQTFLKSSTVLNSDEVEQFKETLGLTKDVLPLHPLISFK